MMNNLRIPLLAAFFLASSLSFGQRPDRDKIKTLKVAFITERLDLNTKEAQEFWPIYNEYEEDREALRQKERGQIRNKIKESENLSEKEATDLLKQYLKFEEEEEELDKAFIEKVTKVISAKKTLLLLRSEEEFKRQLIKQYRQKRSGGGGFR
jgi:hypothetical protein